MKVSAGVARSTRRQNVTTFGRVVCIGREKKTEILFESLGVVAYRRLAYSIRGLTGIRALECDP